jgi:lipoate-protein ligase B
MGTYVQGRKLGSVGIRVAEGVSMHGIGLNVDPDLMWFTRMSACGAPDVPATSITGEGGGGSRDQVEQALSSALFTRLGLTPVDRPLVVGP